jgi:hypothetical protein
VTCKNVALDCCAHFGLSERDSARAAQYIGTALFRHKPSVEAATCVVRCLRSALTSLPQQSRDTFIGSLTDTKVNISTISGRTLAQKFAALQRLAGAPPNIIASMQTRADLRKMVGSTDETTNDNDVDMGPPA